ncbi:PAS domain-containing protein [Actinomycetospora chibensis]|uniref:PAS domain-containing protein n=1 Tax=Actinomycetospora chibensis TaxID=663606 RepID=A0ABV9RB72_9PSEU|nr:PAS domain-containing protein [Actinomycetospora chibensis]MDD7923651.1 PAS domain-containing protein [Actinomycetospora chibensis]
MITSRDLAAIPRDTAGTLVDPVGAGRPVETALLDGAGVVVWVDDAWVAFCRANGGDPARAGIGCSYLALCDAAAATDRHSAIVASAIRAALRGDLPAPARIEVPCDAPTHPRVFDVLVSSRRDDRGRVLGATVTLSETEPAEPLLVSPGPAPPRPPTPRGCAGRPC